jgi:TolA-binding protein
MRAGFVLRGKIMRRHLLGFILLAGVAAPALAQRAEPIERRVDRIEQQLHAVQRRVFPNGAGPNGSGNVAEPEIPADVQAAMGGAPGGSAIANLTTRVDALEAQLRSLTGQVEQQAHRTGEIEDQIARLRTEMSGRIDRLEPATRPANPPASRPTQPAGDDEPAAPARPARSGGGGGGGGGGAVANAANAEDAYNVGFHLWEQRRFGDAETALEEAATRFPSGRWLSWTRNLQGRAYLDDSKPATAARILLANYQDNPQGERAPDSLYYLGQALTRLNRRTEACRVYDELARVYPNARDAIRSRLGEARTAARCTAAAAAARE